MKRLLLLPFVLFATACQCLSLQVTATRFIETVLPRGNDLFFSSINMKDWKELQLLVRLFKYPRYNFQMHYDRIIETNRIPLLKQLSKRPALHKYFLSPFKLINNPDLALYVLDNFESIDYTESLVEEYKTVAIPESYMFASIGMQDFYELILSKIANEKQILLMESDYWIGDYLRNHPHPTQKEAISAILQKFNSDKNIMLVPLLFELIFEENVEQIMEISKTFLERYQRGKQKGLLFVISAIYTYIMRLDEQSDSTDHTVATTTSILVEKLERYISDISLYDSKRLSKLQSTVQDNEKSVLLNIENELEWQQLAISLWNSVKLILSSPSTRPLCLSISSSSSSSSSSSPSLSPISPHPPSFASTLPLPSSPSSAIPVQLIESSESSEAPSMSEEQEHESNSFKLSAFSNFIDQFLKAMNYDSLEDNMLLAHLLFIFSDLFPGRKKCDIFINTIQKLNVLKFCPLVMTPLLTVIEQCPNFASLLSYLPEIVKPIEVWSLEKRFSVYMRTVEFSEISICKNKSLTIAQASKLLASLPKSRIYPTNCMLEDGRDFISAVVDAQQRRIKGGMSLSLHSMRNGSRKENIEMINQFFGSIVYFVIKELPMPLKQSDILTILCALSDEEKSIKKGWKKYLGSQEYLKLTGDSELRIYFRCNEIRTLILGESTTYHQTTTNTE